MLKECASAVQLADMIARSIGASGVEIIIREDHAYGWRPNVVAAPGDLIGFQRQAEELANRPRVRFDLAPTQLAAPLASVSSVAVQVLRDAHRQAPPGPRTQ